MNSIKIVPRKFDSDSKRRVIARNIFDIIIDGESLTDKLIDGKFDTLPVFGFYDKAEYELPTIQEFLKEKNSELESKRILLFICRECGDIGCGAITVDIEKAENSYKWNSFAWENGDNEIITSDFIDFNSLEFTKSEYEVELNNLRKNWL